MRMRKSPQTPLGQAADQVQGGVPLAPQRGACPTAHSPGSQTCHARASLPGLCPPPAHCPAFLPLWFSLPHWHQGNGCGPPTPGAGFTPCRETREKAPRVCLMAEAPKRAPCCSGWGSAPAAVGTQPLWHHLAEPGADLWQKRCPSAPGSPTPASQLALVKESIAVRQR